MNHVYMNKKKEKTEKDKEMKKAGHIARPPKDDVVEVKTIPDYGKIPPPPQKMPLGR